ncbi:MAG: hypothetical protein KKF62_14035 [Bacteroidetes bacterium]|nr:hypothetical protein [Bacteroidota bacterium]MBU1114213.1 hypothetical protein [Bacteroidota bacterium]MBU1797022.1 hypothetical protein [Bacteroidota bacterium]
MNIFKVLSVSVLLVLLVACTEHEELSFQLDGKILTAISDIYQYDLKLKKETLFYKEKSLGSGIMSISYYDDEHIIYGTITKTIKKLNLKTKLSKEIGFGMNPFCIPSKRILYFFNSKNIDSDITLWKANYDSLDSAKKILSLGKRFEGYSTTKIVQISDSTIVLTNKDEELVIININNNKIKKTPFKYYHPIFYDDICSLLYCYSTKSDWTTYKIDMLKEKVSEIDLHIEGNALYVKKYHAAIFAKARISLKYGETGDLMINFLHNDNSYEILERTRFNQGIYFAETIF